MIGTLTQPVEARSLGTLRQRSLLREGIGVEVDVVLDEGRDEEVGMVVAYVSTYVSEEHSLGHPAKLIAPYLVTTY